VKLAGKCVRRALVLTAKQEPTRCSKAPNVCEKFGCSAAVALTDMTDSRRGWHVRWLM